MKISTASELYLQSFCHNQAECKYCPFCSKYGCMIENEDGETVNNWELEDERKK